VKKNNTANHVSEITNDVTASIETALARVSKEIEALAPYKVNLKKNLLIYYKLDMKKNLKN